MEAYEQGQSTGRVYTGYNKFRNLLSGFFSAIITLITIGVMFLIASLEGFKSIEVSPSESGKLLEKWRTDNGYTEQVYPEEKTDIVEFNNIQYYFVIVEDDPLTPEIEEWHFAYDSNMTYMFQGWKFWFLTMISVVFSTLVSNINFDSTVKGMMKTKEFLTTLEYYRDAKEKVKPYTDLIPYFCIYKNKQVYETLKRDVVEDAGINYDSYNSKNFDESKLMDWQKKILKNIEKIKIRRLHSNDLLQEKGMQIKEFSLLPVSQSEYKAHYLLTGSLSKILTSFLSGTVLAFGVSIGNWYVGATYAVSIFLSASQAIINAGDFAMNTLRNRYLAKADLLIEMYNMKDQLIAERERVKAEEQKKAEAELKLKEEQERLEKIDRDRALAEKILKNGSGLPDVITIPFNHDSKTAKSSV